MVVKEIQISDGIVPLGEFKAQAAKLLKRIGESGQPMVITQNGRPAGVLLSPREYDRMQKRQRFLESIAARPPDVQRFGAAILHAVDPQPSKMNLSPLPSSIRKHAAACLERGIGMPEPHAMTRISSAPSSSVPGKYTSWSG